MYHLAENEIGYKEQNISKWFYNPNDEIVEIKMLSLKTDVILQKPVMKH